MDSEVVPTVLGTVATGIGATAVMDLWAFIQWRLFGTPSLDYRLVGRWIGHFPEGTFLHPSIGKAAPVRGELILGWLAHYGIGVAFALLLIVLWSGWLQSPTLLPALIVGLGSIVAPFFIMQPCFGIGVAASRTPQPWISRFRSLLSHTAFALGLYASGYVISQVMVGRIGG